MHVRIATRRSPLALWQAELVAASLRSADPSVRCELVTVETRADRRLDVPIWSMGGKGIFVKEVQAAVLEGRADVAVHSAKDLPSTTPAELTLAAVPPRGDHRDVLVGGRLEDLAPGAVVATGAPRRRAQLAWTRPDLTFRELRGNIATRLQRLREGVADVIVMASVALERLGLDDGDLPVEVLDPATMLPQVGQGALAVECLARAAGGSGELAALVTSLDDAPSRRTVEAERAFLAQLGGDCDLPAGAHATLVDVSASDVPASDASASDVPASDASASDVPPTDVSASDVPASDRSGTHVRIEGMVATADGHVLARATRTGPDGAAAARSLAAELAAPHAPDPC